MATTLKAGIISKLRLIINNKSLIDLTRNRDTTQTIEEDRLDAVAELAAAEVHEVLDDDADGVNGDEPKYVAIGVKIALLNLSQIYNVLLTQEGLNWISNTKNELEAMRVRRVAARTHPQLPTETDGNLQKLRELDELYPTETPWDPTEQED